FPSPSRIAMLSSPTLATARSVKASLLKSPVTIELGASPTDTGVPAVNWPNPFPSRIETLSDPSLATARSGAPPLKLPTATEVGWVPTGTSLLKKLTAAAPDGTTSSAPIASAAEEIHLPAVSPPDIAIQVTGSDAGWTGFGRISPGS